MHPSDMEWLSIVTNGAMQRIFVTDGFTFVLPKDLFDGAVIQLTRYLCHLMQLLYQQSRRKGKAVGASYVQPSVSHDVPCI